MTDKMCIKCHKDNQWFRSEFCFSCMKDENERQLTDRILSGVVVETEYEDDIVCPWCGTRQKDRHKPKSQKRRPTFCQLDPLNKTSWKAEIENPVIVWKQKKASTLALTVSKNLKLLYHRKVSADDFFS